ncbi:unnamed protein product [Ceratitis capitata]|uniref:(Mediterranean fruit fly) hypothetical protein n=1 Tax=Ceratitis capitata TaxID=7213 RepID=A0A811UVD2_CERCA|nr:unnamed protein product [Ceratitis capitata]
MNFPSLNDGDNQNAVNAFKEQHTNDLHTFDGVDETSPMLSATSSGKPSSPATIPASKELPPAPTEIDNVPVTPFRTKPNPHLQVKPAYIDDAHRQFWNPISYLGGPHLLPRDRNSITSILSLD